MNQNTTIETIREAIRQLGANRSALVDVAIKLGDLANRLEAEPQPLKEQSEPKHPLHAGYVIIDGKKRELRRHRTNGGCGIGMYCPHCTSDADASGFIMCTCGAERWSNRFVGTSYEFWLAPPAVIEPEPELDEFEAHLEYLANMSCNNDREQSILDNLLDKYREIVTRKGDK